MPANPKCEREPRPSGRRLARFLIPVFATCLLVAVAVLWLLACAAPRMAAPTAEPPALQRAAAAAAPATEGGPAGAAASRTPAPPLPQPAAPTFAEYVDRLVAFGLATARHHEAGEFDAAQASDAAARATFTEMMERLPEAEAAALAALADVPPPADARDAAGHLRRRVWNLALDAGLQRRHARAVESSSRAPLDTLVTAALTAMPAGDDLAAELAAGHLEGRPFLGSAHEEIVLELAALAGEGRFPTAVATALLTTLWRNLQASGERSSGELTNLALLLLDDPNTSKRASACRQLLGDPRLRLLVLDQVRRSRDATLAREVAMAAAQDLPPADALEVLRTALPLTGEFPAPFLVLGSRDAEPMQREYEQRLADGIDPRLREALVGGAGFGGSPRGIELARLAFDSDPDPDVRLRAVFVLTANAADALGERTIAAALDDPRIRDDPRRLHALVLALGNLERAGAINAVDRLGQRLRACTGLTAVARDDLEQLLARALPGGRTSR
jgi:hypothetical protein